MNEFKMTHDIVKEYFAKIPYSPRSRCSYCIPPVDLENPTWEGFYDSILNCTICKLDIMSHGEYTGYGYEYLYKLYNKYPDDERWLTIILQLTPQDNNDIEI